MVDNGDLPGGVRLYDVSHVPRQHLIEQTGGTDPILRVYWICRNLFDIGQTFIPSSSISSISIVRRKAA
jgi:hypothetical protein